MVKSTMVIALVVSLAVGALAASIMMPIGVNALMDDRSTTLNQSVGDTNDITSGLNVTLDSADGTNATYTLETDTDSDSVTVAQGNSQNATLEGYEVTVSPSDVGTSYSEATFDYPPQIGYSDGAQALWGILDVIMILAVFLLFIGVALSAADRV